MEKMVAISLYRGNLHRVPDVRRRWLMPNPKISLKDFKSLLLRRSRALSLVRTTTTFSFNPNANPNSPPKSQTEAPAINGSFRRVQSEAIKNGEGPSRRDDGHKESELLGPSLKKPEAGTDSFEDSKSKLPEKVSEPVDGCAASMENQIVLIRDKGDLLSEKEQRRRVVEDKLQILNAKKHNLVLVLKQILNAEEELKRQSGMQGTSTRPSVPLQADGTNDTGSMGKHGASRISSEVNLGDDVEGVALDDLSNHNIHSRHMLRMGSMSPSSESPLRRTPTVQQNAVSHPHRASLGTTVSSSRFALSGHQTNPVNPPLASVSGTSYIASSPSPAASGGTSVFRDARHPSPWN